MSQETRTIKCTCLCGNAAHQIALPQEELPLPGVFCHCTSCRRASGTMCLTVATLPASYQPPKSILKKLKPFEFSKRITNYFCPMCGSAIYSHFTRSDGIPAWDVFTGALEKADGVFDVKAHAFIEDTVDGGISDFLPEVDGKHIARYPRSHDVNDEEIPLYWRSRSRTKVLPKDGDRLHVHCKCEGVQLWIGRPNPDHLSKIREQGWARLTVPGCQKYLAGLCGCDSCRIGVGMEWASWAFVPTEDLSLDAEGKVPFRRDFGTLKAYRSSLKATRYFCGTCGAHVLWDGDMRPHFIDVGLGLLDAPEGARAENWFQWRVEFGPEEDTIPRAKALTEGMKVGLMAYKDRTSST